MKRTMSVSAVSLSLALVMAGCASTPDTTSGRVDVQKQVKPFYVVQHQFTKTGGEIPAWVNLDTSDIQALPQYKDKTIFKLEKEGKSVEGVKTLIDLDFNAEVATNISQKIQTKAKGALVGSADRAEAYLEKVTQTTASASISGIKKESQFWTQLQYYKEDGKTPDTGRLVYTVYTLYSVPTTSLTDQITKALTGADTTPPKSDEEKRARELVKASLAEGF